MRRLITILLSFVVLSCTNEEYSHNGFTFDRKTYEVGYEGGSVTVHFTMDGRYEMPHVASYNSWVTIEKQTKSTLTLSVAKNFGSERETEISFSNPINGNDAYITIRQAAYRGKRQIDVSVSDITTRCCTARAKATNKDMLLICFMDNNEYIDEDIENWDFIVRRMVSSYKRSAEEQNISFVDYLAQNNRGGYGSVEFRFDDLMPGYMMNFGAFGISYDEKSGDYELLTPIYYKSFYCKTPERQDIEFSTDVKVEGADVAMTIDPGSWDGYYAYNILSKERSGNYFPPSTTIDEDIHLKWSKAWYAEFHRNVVNGTMSAEEFVDLYCSKGRQSLDETLYALEDYLLVVYAIDFVEGAPQIVSPLHCHHFTTEDVGRSDMTVEVEFKEVYGRMVRFDVIPSNNEDSYVLGVIAKEYVDSVPESSIIGSLTSYIDPINDVRYGKQSVEALLLQPETEYVVCVVGTHGNMITTDLLCYEFTTGVAEPCAVAVENITIGGPCSLHDLYEYDSSYVDPSYLELPEYMVGVCWYEIETSGEPYKIYSGLIRTRQFDNYYEEDLYSLLMQMPSSNLETYFVTYDEEMVVLCCLMDDRGNTTEIYRSEPVLMRIEDNRDPSELAEVLDRMAGRTRSVHAVINEAKSSVSVADNGGWMPLEYVE